MLKEKKVYAVIGAAGAGKRMSAPVPKQFLRIDGKTILEITVEKFAALSIIDEIVVVAAAGYIPHGRRFCGWMIGPG